MMGLKKWAMVVVITTLAACGQDNKADKLVSLDAVAEKYVHLVLALGEHEAGYVDAYYGPEEWAEAAKTSPTTLPDLKEQAQALLTELGMVMRAELDTSAQDRHTFMTKQLIAVEARIRMLEGEKFTFDEETELLFDAVSPGASEEELDTALAELDAMLSGEGSLESRIAAFRANFVVPADKLDGVFKAAIAACRERTSHYLDLPEVESFTLEYVKDKSWSGYNWYQGGAQSLIQVNTDFPISINRAIDLGCHEGYPGHHVFNALLEKNMVMDRGWVEFSVYPLYSPQSLLAEGTANYGIEMAFPGEEKRKFETEVLYPLAGLDPTKAEDYDRLLAVMGKMKYARTEGARRYLDGKMSRDDFINWTAKYSLMSKERAEQSVRFTEQYRGYVINYTLGMDLAAAYVDRHAQADRKSRWTVYESLLSNPRTASMITQ